MVKTDASKNGITGILLQQQNGEWRIIECCSRQLTPSERNYAITELEGLAVVYSVTKFRHYLLGRKFQILTDHCSLCVLKSKMPQSSRLRRWALVLSESDFDIVFTNGSLHKDVDCLGRAPVTDEVDPYLDKILALPAPINRLE